MNDTAIKKAVNSLLKKLYPSHRVYGVEVTEGYIAPCFFVNLLPTSHESVNANTDRVSYSVMIDFFQASVNETEQLEVYQAVRKAMADMDPSGKGKPGLVVGDRFFIAADFTRSYIGQGRNILEIEFDITVIYQTAEFKEHAVMEHEHLTTQKED